MLGTKGIAGLGGIGFTSSYGASDHCCGYNLDLDAATAALLEMFSALTIPGAREATQDVAFAALWASYLFSSGSPLYTF